MDHTEWYDLTRSEWMTVCVFVAVCQQHCTKVYNKNKAGSHWKTKQSSELWSRAKHTGPSLRMQTPYPTTAWSRPEGVADGHFVLLFPLLSLSIVLACTVIANPSTNNSIQAGRFHFLQLQLTCSCGGWHLSGILSVCYSLHMYPDL